MLAGELTNRDPLDRRVFSLFPNGTRRRAARLLSPCPLPMNLLPGTPGPVEFRHRSHLPTKSAFYFFFSHHLTNIQSLSLGRIANLAGNRFLPRWVPPHHIPQPVPEHRNPT